ncbi:MAG: Xaa-Pro peptidase family protein [Nitrososphaerota archaeon]|nr:Xaa-Pro peptidase family protein [Candidatus Bathyarchaeota archaeon]MDW8023914.1 Xaa-Pro peptidase family protein [Nitrososphaerota archaeon]
MNKLNALKQKAFEEKGFDGFLIMNEANMLYFASFPGATCLLIPKNGESILYVYGVNYEQAKAEGKGFQAELIRREENLMAKVAAQVKAFKIEKLAFDTLTLENHRLLVRELKGEVKLKMQNKLIWELRKVKDSEELMLMRKAAELAREGMKAAYEVIRPGIKEYEAAAEIEYAMRRKGSWGTAFETIVASGPRSAFPHGGCTEREIGDGDLVVVDIGASYHYYCSDITRTLVAGRPSEKQKRLYEIVKKAQEKAIQAIKPRVKAKVVDTAARQVIEEAGYGKYFVHGLGHGLGLEVHEPPTLNPQSRERLEVGNVATIEPGIYIGGFGGIRIEDMVLVEKNGAEKFTSGWYTLEVGK